MAARAGESHLGLVAAGVAFFSMLSVFPALAALVALWGMVADPALVAEELERGRDYLPPEAFAIVAAQIEAVTGGPSGRLGWAGALTLAAALWSARAGVAALMQGLCAVHGTPQRSGIAHQVAALAMTLALVAAALAVLAAGIVVPLALAFAPLGPAQAWAVAAARWTVLPLITLTAMALLFRYGPNLPGRRVRFLSPGLWLAFALWVAASEAFALYLANFPTANAVYGSIGAVAALMIWVYLGAYAVLMGGALNAVLAGKDQ